MKAHVIENNIVVNTIEVPDLDFMQNLIDASNGGSIGDTWDGENFIPKETEMEIPIQVTMRQARLALLQAGLLDDIETAINSIEDETIRKSIQIEWEYAMDIRRDWQALKLVTQQMGMTDDQLDELFLTASKL